METGMKGSFTTRKGALYCIVMTCLCSLLATGCASKYGAQTTDVHYYPDCYQPIADLRSAEKSFNTTMVMGTTMGALLGAVIGASQTGKAEGALAGAAIGAGAGAGASYLVAKYNNERDDRVRLASYARDLNADVNSLNRVTAAGQVAYNCYSAKFRAALEDYKAKRITRAELDQRYAEIKSGLAEASAILGSTLSEADKREAEYRQVLILREIHQCTYDEIAQICSIDLGTVKSRINRGRKRLRKILLESGNFSAAGASKKTEKEGCR